MEMINSSTLLSAGRDHLEDDLPGVIAMTIYMTLLAILGLIGNVLVIVSVVISPQLRNTSYTFIVSLSIADLLINILVIPIISYSLFNYGWPSDLFWCGWVNYMFFLTTGISLITLMVIAVSRYCLVHYSQTLYRKYCGWRGVATSVFCIVFCTGLVMVLIPISANLVVVHYDAGVHFCYIDNSDTKTFWYMSCVLICGALSCFVLIPILYYKTFKVLHRSKRRVCAARHRRAWNNNNPPPQHYLNPAEVRFTKMVAPIFIFMALCWIPLWIMHFCRLSMDVPHGLQRAGVLLLLTNSSVNPYLYAWLNKRFSRAYKRVLLCGRHPRARLSQVMV